MSNRLRLAALRPYDLLALEVEFVNLQPAADGGLERATPGQPVFVIVHFSPQHLTKQVFAGNSAAAEPPPIRTSMAGESRLVFRLPEAMTRLPLTLPDLLSWETWQLVAPSGPPGELETAIEFPWRLILSPSGAARWHHTLEPVSIDGNIEVWRTHLMHPAGPDAGATLLVPGGDLRALTAIEGQEPFPSPLAIQDRRDLVQLTSIAAGLQGTRPLNAASFSLSILGATVDLLGEWPDGPPTHTTVPGITICKNTTNKEITYVISSDRDHRCSACGSKRPLATTADSARKCAGYDQPVEHVDVRLDTVEFMASNTEHGPNAG